jgi:D-tyrosyl-tRNA(Tyr) deacylase
VVALVQRVRHASVSIDEVEVGRIGHGLLILLGVHRQDSDGELEWVARKCANLRIFGDDEGRMNRSVRDVDGRVLVVSQFTLYGDVRRGNRPSFVESAPPDHAIPIYRRLVDRLGELTGTAVETGEFGAMMDVQLVNDGPVTIWIEKHPEDDQP